MIVKILVDVKKTTGRAAKKNARATPNGARAAQKWKILGVRRKKFARATPMGRARHKNRLKNHAREKSRACRPHVVFLTTNGVLFFIGNVLFFFAKIAATF